MPSHPSKPKTLAGDPGPGDSRRGDARRYGVVSPGAQNQCLGGVLCHGALLRWSFQPDQVTKGNTKVVCTIGGENGILLSR